MLNKLQVLEDKYIDLTEKISDMEIINDQKVWQKYMKEHADLEPIVFKYREYRNVLNDLSESKSILEEESDEDLRELAKMEISELEGQVEPLEAELKILLLPKDPNDDKNVIVEIRGGAGGDEAALFAGNLFRMYSRYAERRRWKMELLSASDTGVGGYKEVSFLIKGKGAYSRLKYESGVHRVQRIPATESGGRIHTSTATVAVLPEVEDVEVEISPNDLRIDVFRASGNGGQCVNTTDSAVRITHLPTGEVVSCQDEKSQLKNKEKALKVLKARLYDKALSDQHDEVAAERRSQVGTGDRSERIRTYNYPQGRVSDHRINLTLYKLEQFLDGDLDEMIDALITEDQTKKMTAI
ncbi:MAG: peptide chain release factor 1 [Terrisporobacter othiniensis]|uniref:Peptide chain release factor 1 n=2 Tax=Terrisporobacter TaxID=1505652 RepID=A0AAX2ZMB8_9FIRM|nr:MULTISPECIES: peptide chain release factor 1 [Terrisporobacter]MBN9647830.1 peptide chain release factor 1 [Terrisporobacter glycolicus]MDU4861294.1 peptide chain release factor 1 [Terrisporobacter othiniensis]MDU6994928.1 peptide chain release factor 1 [Terrisporobacter othiniensis]UEL49410.1 peptide chain release factor 1 [Terrisporobacter hibernicus]UPA30623.1 peptide chain release factor 1 [Terrisporobacter glycolicus]